MAINYNTESNEINYEELIKELKSKGLSLKNLARELDIDYSTLYRKMSGISDFNLKEINAVCNALNIKDGRHIFFPEWIA